MSHVFLFFTQCIKALHGAIKRHILMILFLIFYCVYHLLVKSKLKGLFYIIFLFLDTTKLSLALHVQGLVAMTYID